MNFRKSSLGYVKLKNLQLGKTRWVYVKINFMLSKPQLGEQINHAKCIHAGSQIIYKTWKIQTFSMLVFWMFSLQQQSFVQDVKVL